MSIQQIEHISVVCTKQTSSLTEAGGLEQVVAHYRPNTSACISEKILGFGRELPTDSEEREEPTSRASGEVLWTRTRPAVAAAEQHSP